ncbi:unnamed protein product, partial [Brachionus calyciflorus]
MDIWTSVSNDPYISVTLHFLVNTYKLCHLLLEMKHFPETHNYKIISAVVNSIVIYRNIRDRTSYIPSDNVSNMAKAFSKLKKDYEKDCIKIAHIRCS